MKFPLSATVNTTQSYEGDLVIDFVTYPTDKDPNHKTVKFIQTNEGYFIPETGYTVDGDFSYPEQRLDY